MIPVCVLLCTRPSLPAVTAAVGPELTEFAGLPGAPARSARSPRSYRRIRQRASRSPRAYPARRSSSSPTCCLASPAGPAPSSPASWNRPSARSGEPRQSWAAALPRRTRARRARGHRGLGPVPALRRPPRPGPLYGRRCRPQAFRPTSLPNGSPALSPAAGTPGWRGTWPRAAGPAASRWRSCHDGGRVRLVRLTPRAAASRRPGPAGGVLRRPAGCAVRALGRLRRAQMPRIFETAAPPSSRSRRAARFGEPERATAVWAAVTCGWAPRSRSPGWPPARWPRPNRHAAGRRASRTYCATWPG